jgi:hypothetical protein
MNRAHRRGTVERLADFPRAPHFAHLHLQVATGHIDADGVAPHMIERLLDFDVRATLADHGNEFRFVVIVLRLRRIRQFKRFAIGDGDDGIGRLAEEERRLAIGIEAHFARMRRVVAPHAINAAHGELSVASSDGNSDGRFGSENESHDGVDSTSERMEDAPCDRARKDQDAPA